MTLTDAKIRALKPRAKPFKTADFDGLYITTRKSGSRLWHFKYRVDGKEKLLSFVAYPAVSLAQARKARDEARADLAAGVDPGIARKEAKRLRREASGNSFEIVAQAFITKSAKEGRAPATMTKTEWLIGMANAEFGRKPIGDITSPMVLRCLRRVEAKGNYETARRLRAKIGAVFRYAVASGLAETDPTYALRDALIRPTVTPRAAITDPKALGGLLRAIDAFEGQTTTQIALRLLALVAQGLCELRHATWTEFDVDAAIWSISAERTKMRRPHKVPPPAQALALLDELRPLTGSGRYLFPSLRTHRRPISENTLNGALRRMGYSGDEMTSHGFRATFSTLANESGLWTLAPLSGRWRMLRRTRLGGPVHGASIGMNGSGWQFGGLENWMNSGQGRRQMI